METWQSRRHANVLDPRRRNNVDRFHRRDRPLEAEKTAAEPLKALLKTLQARPGLP